MTATTSGLTEFSLDVDEIIEHALEPVGGDYTNANDQSKARRTLNLILIELQNKNIPLNKIDTQTLSLAAGPAVYTLDASVSDVLEATLKTTSSGVETTLDRWGRKEYHQIPDKDTEGRPTLFTTDRSTSGVKIEVWPVAEAASTYTLEALVVKKIEDINAAYQKIDLPYRYFPLLVSWLSYKLSISKQGIGEDVIQRLKLELDTIMMDTFDEDRERVDFLIVPGGISGR